MATATGLMTTEEFLALPDDGIDRDLIRGEVRERGMSTRGFPHAWVSARLAYLLGAWLDPLPRPRGYLVVGEARVRLQRSPDTFVGIDLAYISADLAARTSERARYIDGPPDLAVEILSPSDTVEDIDDKVAEYLAGGVPHVWIVNPYSRTVTIYRPDMRPQLVNEDQELTAEPHLPRLRIPVAQIFAR